MIRLVGLLKRDEGPETQKDVVDDLHKSLSGDAMDVEEGDSDLEIEVI